MDSLYLTSHTDFRDSIHRSEVGSSSNSQMKVEGNDRFRFRVGRAVDVTVEESSDTYIPEVI